ncbi:hypothetical protein GCM10007862_34760 [Dyella lipolytica]|uniref:aspartyl protease family protein n=1 Tax=Dyella lipolytica TaxID=1867835 RepID=UPI00235D0AF0|nr:hypothetical protein GCM10007862_34760 [Dyella lipolytica]
MRVSRFCCLCIGVLLASQAWADSCQLKDYGTLPVEMVGGRATTMVKINGNNTRFALDTGAFFNIMSSANAASLGLKLRQAPMGFRISGIGGLADAQITRVKEFGILDTTLKNIDFIVGGTDSGYALLGANLLDFADLEIDLAHGKLTLFKAEHCDKVSLAYWSKDGKYNVVDIEPAANGIDRRTLLSVTINGKKVQAVLDSGAYATMLSRSAAERIGIDLNAPDVKAGNSTYGFGAKLIKTWTVPIDSFSVGTETIQHSQMLVIDGRLGDDKTDMLLGMDFLLAHRMFIANSKKKAYFTYNGGRVFAFAEAPSDSDKSDAGTAAADTPKTASDYALLGEAHLSRGEPNAAVADLDDAIRMAPDQAAYYFARARAHAADKQPDAALADLDKSLSLDPKNVDALLLRAQFRIAHKDRTGAAADVTAASALAPAGSSQARSIATLYIQLDQPAAALPILDDWIRLHSNNDAMLGSALNERCWARGLNNQMLDDALSDCRKAIKRDGENPAYIDSLGMVQLRLGHYSESIKAYQQAVARNPRSAWSRYGLGLAKIRNGQTDAGKADLVAARALDPEIDARATKFGLTAAGP